MLLEGSFIHLSTKYQVCGWINLRAMHIYITCSRCPPWRCRHSCTRRPKWAPHSPDMSPPDYYLWGYAKDRVYETNPRTLLELKREVTRVIQAIPQEQCSRVIDNFGRHVQLCLQRQGGHLEHVI